LQTQKVAALALLILVVSPTSTRAGFEKEEAELQALIADAKYLTAANYINDRTDLRLEPRFIRHYTHLLTTQYVYSINFVVFALKDLKKGERVEDYRGKPGSYQMVGTRFDETLYDAYKKNPNSPDLNFALGEYLSRGQSCGCRESGPIKDLSGDDGPYFLKAHKGGVADDWSLFRIGVHHHGAGRLDDAISFYKKSLSIDPTQVAANYNLAAAYYKKKDDKNALAYATKALGKYDNTELNADTWHLHGVILVALKDDAGAEKSLDQAHKLNLSHEAAFKNLLALYRRTNQDDKYLKRVQDYIALDYGNTYPFNVYVDYLTEAGQTDLDRKIEQHLLALKLTEPKQTGALYFNLARMADTRNDQPEALRRYERSLAAFKTMMEPPEGAVPAVEGRIRELSKK
jgi:tetratricopeptide (TPR) repeat protein